MDLCYFAHFNFKLFLGSVEKHNLLSQTLVEVEKLLLSANKSTKLKVFAINVDLFLAFFDSYRLHKFQCDNSVHVLIAFYNALVRISMSYLRAETKRAFSIFKFLSLAGSVFNC